MPHSRASRGDTSDIYEAFFGQVFFGSPSWAKCGFETTLVGDRVLPCIGTDAHFSERGDSANKFQFVGGQSLKILFADSLLAEQSSEHNDQLRISEIVFAIKFLSNLFETLSNFPHLIGRIHRCGPAFEVLNQLSQLGLDRAIEHVSSDSPFGF